MTKGITIFSCALLTECDKTGDLNWRLSSPLFTSSFDLRALSSKQLVVLPTWNLEGVGENCILRIPRCIFPIFAKADVRMEVKKLTPSGQYYRTVAIVLNSSIYSFIAGS